MVLGSDEPSVRKASRNHVSRTMLALSRPPSQRAGHPWALWAAAGTGQVSTVGLCSTEMDAVGWCAELAAFLSTSPAG